MIRKLLLFVGCIASPGVCSACDKPAGTAPQSAVQVPDYIASSDEAPAPKGTAAENAWRSYQDSVFEALSHSPNPRDWALATATARLRFELRDLDRHQHGDLIERAMRAAPDDILVQWIALNYGEPTHDAALRSLRRLEPDNAAIWMEDLTTATKRKDDAGIDIALAKMSSSSRFDFHFVDVLKAATEAYQHLPVSDEYLAAASEETKSASKDDIAYTNAMAVVAGVTLPALQHLVNACRIDSASGKNIRHAADCAAVGRLMTARGDTLLANRIGVSLLRVSHSYTDEDLRVAREIDWVYQNYMNSLSPRAGDELSKDYIARYRDWIETGNEVESMRRAEVRKGIAPKPPEDWVDTLSLFSAERLRGDAEWFDKNATK